MFRFNRNDFITTLYHSPADNETVDTPLNKSDIFSALNDDTTEDNDEPADDEIKIDLKEDDDQTDDKTDNDEDEEEVDELKELEEELEEPDDEKLELTTPVRRGEILKKYPTLFKDFPYLEKAYYREQKFTELLGTIQDAEETVEKAKSLDAFESDLMEGNTERLFEGIKKDDPEAFNKLVDNYLPTLKKIDEKAYLHVVGNLTKTIVASAIREATSEKNETLEAAAQIMYKFVFGNTDWKPPTNLSTGKAKDDPKENEISEREKQFNQRLFDHARGEVTSKISNALKSVIDQNIDPKGSMTDYVKRNATSEVLNKVQELVMKDTRMKVLLDKLWESAQKNGYTDDDKRKIRSAFLSKAKTVLPTLIKSVRNEALKGSAKKTKTNDSEEESIKETRKSTSSSNSGNKNKGDGKIPRGMSTLDYLMQD